MAFNEERRPPSNVEAEQHVLAAVVNDNERFHVLGGILKDEHFFDVVHRHLWRNIKQKVELNELANPITLRPYLEKLEPSGLSPAKYLAAIASMNDSDETIIAYAKEIRNLFYRRQCILISQSMMDEAYDGGPDKTAESIIASYDAMMGELRPSISERRDYEAFSESSYRAVQRANDAYKRAGAMVGLSTGYEKLDDAIGGLQAPDLIIIAGRPGMGKTALATNIAVNIAKTLNPTEGVVAFASLEMSAEQVSSRIIAEQAGLPGWKVRRGKLDQHEMEKLDATSREFRKLPLHIDETGTVTVSELRMRLRNIQKTRGLKLVVVDYLQLLSSSNARDTNRYAIVTQVSGALKGLAKELKVPVIALSQLSRQVESRDLKDRRPHMGDLRESGAIEQDADIIAMIYREEYYLKRLPKPPQGSQAEARRFEDERRAEGLAEIIIAKNRHGSESTIELGFDGNLTRFTNEVPDRAPAPAEMIKAANGHTFTPQEWLCIRMLRDSDFAESITLDRIGVVKGVPVQEWAKAVRSKAKIGDDKQFNRKLERVMASLMQKEIIDRHEDHIYLTTKGEALK